MKTMWRTLPVLATMSALVAGAQGQQAPVKVRFTLDWVIQGQHAPFLVNCSFVLVAPNPKPMIQYARGHAGSPVKKLFRT